MALCLKDLEERKEQEAGNRRSIEQAANDLKVKCGLLLHWMVIFQGETFCFLCCSKSLVAPLQLQRPRQLLLLRKRVYSLYPSQHITVKGTEEGRVSKGLALTLRSAKHLWENNVEIFVQRSSK